MALKKLSFDMEEVDIKELDILVARCGYTSRKDLFNDAISFFEFCIQNIEEGGSFPSHVKPDGREIEIAGSAFMYARKKSLEFEKGI